MTFENPQGLWLLALGVPILVFHFYKGRIKRMPVPMLLFWEQVLVEEERRTALRKLRYWASLLLNLAAVFALTSAVADPSVKGLTRSKGRYAVILDNAPSMGALEPGGGTRMAAAVDQAREFVRSRGYGDQVSFHDFSGLRAPFTSELERLAGRMTAPPPTRRWDLRECVVAARAAGEDVTAVLFTSRPPGGVDDLMAGGKLRVARVGTSRDNVGWVEGLPVRRAGEKRVLLTLSLANFSDSEAVREEVLSFNGKELGRRRISLAPGARVEREWPLGPSEFPGEKIEEGGRVQVALEPGDDFPLDDVASFVVPSLVPPTVIVFHPGKPDPLLMDALDKLRAVGVIHPDLVTTDRVERYGSIPLEERWIVVFDRVAPPGPLGRGGYLILGAPGGAWVEGPTIADWDREAPPNHLVDYKGVLLRRSKILEGPPLIRAVEGPVATWSSHGGQAVVETGFAFGDAGLHLAPRLMLFNFVDWAAHRGTRSFRTEYALGEPLRSERPLWVEAGELTFAQAGRVERVEVRHGQLQSIPPADPGFVRISAGGRSEWVAVNLFHAGESDLRGRPEPPVQAPLPPPEPWHAKVPYAVLAVAAVLAILLLEWWLYHRGVI